MTKTFENGTMFSFKNAYDEWDTATLIDNKTMLFKLEKANEEAIGTVREDCGGHYLYISIPATRPGTPSWKCHTIKLGDLKPGQYSDNYTIYALEISHYVEVNCRYMNHSTEKLLYFNEENAKADYEAYKRVFDLRVSTNRATNVKAKVTDEGNTLNYTYKTVTGYEENDKVRMFEIVTKK